VSAVERISPELFRQLPLEVHAILTDVALRDVTCVGLRGGGPSRTLADIRRLTSHGPAKVGGRGARALFALRGWLGRLFGWDRVRDYGDSYATRVPAQLAARSVLPAGSNAGMFRVLYELPHESLVEGRNATVHALLCTALIPAGDDYKLYWAVYVKPVSRLTRYYMAAIEPFRRLIVYPSVLGGVRREWERRYGSRGHA